MPHYYFVHDAERFHALIRPALAASWRQRSFRPCAALRDGLWSQIQLFARENRIAENELLLPRMDLDLPFDRACWRLLVGEVILYAAVEVPEIQVDPELMCPHAALPNSRSAYTPLEQAICGARDLTFGGGGYRPDHAGINLVDDVDRLASCLAQIDPAQWRTDVHVDQTITGDELAFARASLELLRALYDRARARGQLVICESV